MFINIFFNTSAKKRGAVQKKKIQLHGKGKSKRYFIHVRDVAKATLKIAENGHNGEVYHLSPSKGQISIYSLVKMVCEMMNRNFDNSIELIDQNFGQDNKFSISSEKMEKQFGWKPKISLEKGIEETIYWIENNW